MSIVVLLNFLGCCKFSCWLHSDFILHLNQDHQQCVKFHCYICANENNSEGFLALQPKSMINVSSLI